MTFDPTINAGNVLVLGLAILGFIGAWYKFGGRIDMLEYKVDLVEKTLLVISDTLKKIAESEKKMAVMDERQLALERGQAASLDAIEGLRRGEGYIQFRRSNLDGEYSK
ncbi:MAG: hypothetical protein JWQ03_3134 [Variovorax sp.]|nr:hypothetical protein [Variovorax sp.]